ncbi:MAG: BMP family ABC transporter substrate-binding protein [Lachnospiraceae bacterium]|nr:BMP family ABC transporter substrate-binding protein [Lachnospiraceae bacterium]
MKKFIALLMVMVLAGALIACAGNDDTTTTDTVVEADTDDDAGADDAQADDTDAVVEQDDSGDWDGIPIALVTDYGTIDDGSFNQGSWEGVVAYAEENGIPHQYIQPAEKTDAGYLDAIVLAIEGGAQIVVTPGFLFEVSVGEAQSMFPDVKFVLIDGRPDIGEDAPYIADNTVAVLYAEEESGFLAGYAAVMEGHTSLGFIGGIAVPAVVRFGTGFVEGAEYAAAELGLAEGEITINYAYAGTFGPSPEVQTMAASWYNEGVEVIFAAAGGAGFSVFAAAEAAGALAIGVDIDQAGASDTIITSALKGLEASVYSILSDFFAGNFPGGTEKIFDASLNGVGLPMETSRFENFTQAQYDDIFQRLANGEVEVSTEVGPEAHLNLNLSIVEVVNIG